MSHPYHGHPQSHHRRNHESAQQSPPSAQYTPPNVRRAYASGDTLDCSATLPTPSPSFPNGELYMASIDPLSAAGIPQFISTSLKSMSPYNPAFQHAEAVRRLLYDPEFSKSSSYNANQNIVPNAEAMGTVSSKYRPFRSNNSIIDNIQTWIVEIGVLAELEKYVGILFTGLENTGAWKYLEDGQDPATQQGQAGGTSYDHSQHAAAYEDMITPEAVILSMHVSRSHGYEDTTLLEEHLARSPPPQSTSQSVPSKGNTEQIVQLERLSRLCAALKEAAQATLRSLESAPSDITQAGFASMLVSAMWKRAAPINYTAAAASAIVGIGGQVQEWAPQPYVKGVTGILSGLLALTSVLVPDKRGDPDGRLAVLSATSVAIAGLENDMYRLLIAYLELYESVTKILMTHSPGARPLTREDKKRLKQFFEAFKRHFTAIDDATSVQRGYDLAEKSHRGHHPSRSVASDVVRERIERSQSQAISQQASSDSRGRDVRINFS